MTTNDIIPEDDQPAYQPTGEDLEDYEAALKLAAEQDCDLRGTRALLGRSRLAAASCPNVPPWSADANNTKNNQQQEISSGNFRRAF